MTVTSSAARVAPRNFFGLLFSVSVLSAGVALFLATTTLWAGTNLISADDIPPLRPVRAEMPPGFWEQYGLWVSAAGILFIAIAGLAAWMLTRPKPLPPVPPATKARQALEPLRGRPVDGAVLSKVSHVLRHYFISAFGLSPGELTTTEFCGALTGATQLGPNLAVSLTDFLRLCDQHKFAPNTPTLTPIEAVEQALQFIDRAESRLTELRQPSSDQPAQSVTTK